MADPTPSAVPATPPPAHSPPSAWTPAVQRAVIGLLALAVLILGGKVIFDWGYQAGARSARPFADSAGPRVDINRADVPTLRSVPGIGEGLAQRIVHVRTERGPFQKIEDLTAVPGVGQITIEKLRPWVVVSVSNPAPASKPAAFAPSFSSSATMDDGDRRSFYSGVSTNKAEKATPGFVNINIAKVEELQKLPGIGPKLAQRIADERTLRGPFKTADDLRRVSGIGPKTLERVKPFVRTSDPAPPPAEAIGTDAGL